MNSLSKIQGTYVNDILGQTFIIATADDSTGAITGSLATGNNTIEFSGVWNASTVQPNGIFHFNGGVPEGMLSGTGQTDDIEVFASISLGASICQKNHDTLGFSGRFIRA